MAVVKLLVALLLASGCVVETTQPVTTVTAQWTFANLASRQPTGCPAGFSVARLVAQPTDGGDPTLTELDCAAGLGVSAPLAPARYDFVVEILATDGTAYAQSTPVAIDLTDGNDERLDTTILEDAGYARLAWTLVGATTGTALTCADLGGIDQVIVTATGAAGTFVDAFGCDGHAGLTHALPAGDYTISVAAERGGRRIGTAADLASRTIEAKNRITDLGSIEIPITGP